MENENEVPQKPTVVLVVGVGYDNALMEQALLEVQKQGEATFGRGYGDELKRAVEAFSHVKLDIGRITAEQLRSEVIANKPKRTGKRGFNSARNRIICKGQYT